MNKELLEDAFEREFKESRDNWKSLCPFHNERTPSFYVHKDDWISHCFGCDISGYVDTLLSQYANCSIQEARKRLDLKLIEGKVLKRPKVKKPTFFPESWLAPFKNEVHRYVLDRLGDDDDTIEILRSTGTCFDPIKRRQVFPHRDRNERLVGAVGRAIGDRQPKWLFYWDYERGYTLYRPFGIRHSSVVLTEGVFDVIRLRQAGIQETHDLAAPIGANLGKGQLRELREYDEIIFGFDNDAQKKTDTGQNQTEKLYKELRSSARCRFVVFPKEINDFGETPIEKVQELIDNSLTYVQRSALQ